MSSTNWSLPMVGFTAFFGALQLFKTYFFRRRLRLVCSAKEKGVPGASPNEFINRLVEYICTDGKATASITLPSKAAYDELVKMLKLETKTLSNANFRVEMIWKDSDCCSDCVDVILE